MRGKVSWNLSYLQTPPQPRGAGGDFDPFCYARMMKLKGKTSTPETHNYEKAQKGGSSLLWWSGHAGWAPLLSGVMRPPS